MSVTLHTTLGNIKIEVFCDTAQRTSFNFLALCASGYYDNTTFHRNMKGFMIQGGDPTGTGKGGESIWGGTFADEFHPDNTHDKRGVVSMANTGMNTNKSVRFVTVPVVRCDPIGALTRLFVICSNFSLHMRDKLI